MKSENSILQNVHDFMNFSIEDTCKRLSDKYELSTVDGYLQISYRCK